MKRSTNRAKNGPPKWLLQIALVLSLITFSGSIVSSECSHREPTKTELKQPGGANAKRTARLKIYLEASSPPCSPGKTETFISRLFQYQTTIEVKFKNNPIDIPALNEQHKQFVTDYSSDNPSPSDLRA